MKFINTFNSESVMTGALRKQNQKEFNRRNMGIYLRPTGDQFYRFRLLNFPPDPDFVERAGLAYPRDFPFILRHNHVVWERIPDESSQNGVRITCKQIPCPQSDYIRANSNLTGRACPICTAGNQAWSAYKDSGYKNQIAKEKLGRCRSSFEALIPVYVISDPTYDSNNGAVKVLTLNKEQYDLLLQAIQKQSSIGTQVWNENAVDLYISYGKVDKVRPGKNGAPDYHFQANDIIKLGFTTTPHTILNLESLCNTLQFDENWFIIPTLTELQDFYAKYVAMDSNVPDDIPNDIPMDIPVSKPAPDKAPEPVVESIPAEPSSPILPKAPKVAKTVKAPVVPDDIPEMPDTVSAPQPSISESVSQPNQANLDKDIDSFLATLNI